MPAGAGLRRGRPDVLPPPAVDWPRAPRARRPALPCPRRRAPPERGSVGQRRGVPEDQGPDDSVRVGGPPRVEIHTIGFTKKTAAGFFGALKRAGIRLVARYADV